MKKRILTATILFAATVSGFAQSLTETRHIKTTALQVYENYKVVLSSLYSKDNYIEDNFMALFNDNTVLYNDIIPVNTPTLLTPEKYFTKFRENIKRVYPEYSNLAIGEPVSNGGKWQIKCDFTRAARFRTHKDMKYPQWTFNYTMTIEMDKKYDTGKKVYEDAAITNITVDKPLGKYFIVEKQEDMPLFSKSGKLFTNWDEEYQSCIFPENEWKISDIGVSEYNNRENIFEYYKVNFSKNQTDAHFHQPDLKGFPKNVFGIGVNYSPLTFGNEMSEANAENFSDISLKSSDALSLSLFFGKQIAHRNNTTLFLNVGLDLNRYLYNYTGTHDTAYQATDEDKDACLRKISITSLSETVNTYSASVPIGFEYLVQLSKSRQNPVFFSLELGGYVEYRFATTNTFNFAADYTGIYNQYFNVEFDHYDNYGRFELSDKDISQSVKDKINPFDYGVYGSVGLLFAVGKSNLLKFDAGYKHGFTSPMKYNENFVVSSDNNSYESLLQSTKQGLQNICFGISWVMTIGGKK